MSSLRTIPTTGLVKEPSIDRSRVRDTARTAMSAAAAAARLDEALRDDDAFHRYIACARRTEAVAASRFEGYEADIEFLARCIEEGDMTWHDAGSRTAWDMHRGIAFATGGLIPPQPSAPDILDLLSKVTLLTGLRDDALRAMDREEDARGVQEFFEEGFPEGDQWAAAEAYRHLLIHEGFDGFAKRVARAMGPLIVARGFGLSRPCIMTTDFMRLNRRECDAALAAGGDEWALFFFRAVGESSERLLKTLYAITLMRKTMEAACPVQRSTSSVGKAIDRLFERPVFTTNTFAKGMGMTFRGAQKVIDRLVDGRVVNETTDRMRNRVYVCYRIVQL